MHRRILRPMVGAHFQNRGRGPWQRDQGYCEPTVGVRCDESERRIIKIWIGNTRVKARRLYKFDVAVNQESSAVDRENKKQEVTQ